MEINIGARVFCTDGFCGRVDRVILHPETNQVHHLVIDTSPLLTWFVVVPVERIRRSSHEAVYLDLTTEELRQQPTFVETDYEPAPVTYVPPPGFPPASHTLFLRPAIKVRGVEHKRKHPEDFEIRDGMPVEALDGPIGVVDEVVLDPFTRKLTAFVVRRGRFLPRDVTIPLAYVREVEAGRVLLDLTRAQVERLEPHLHIHRPEG